MPSFNIVKKFTPDLSFRNESIRSQFDFRDHEVVEQFIGDIKIEDKEWSIGCIVGRSGTGKTTIARHCFGEYMTTYEYTEDSVINEMPTNKTTNEITNVFNSVGFGTVWSWLKKYSHLSEGEKMRVNLAREILSDKQIICFDEFTSVVDRVVAKTASAAISKYIRKNNKKFIAVTCHRDIITWLEPDWIYDTDSSRFFFANQNIKDPKSVLTYSKSIKTDGKYIKSIII
jgi:ABC-type ATPase with predicted acetyltransferase domain